LLDNARWEIIGVVHPPYSNLDIIGFDPSLVKSKLTIDVPGKIIFKTFFVEGVLFMVDQDMILAVHS